MSDETLINIPEATHTADGTPPYRDLGNPYDDVPTPPPEAHPEDQRHLVPRVRTPLDHAALREALRAGHVLATGEEPSDNRLGCAWAMLVEEHGAGPRSGIWDDNLGNVDAGKSWTGDVFALTADEVIHGVRKSMTKLLRAHATAADGAEDLWELLAARYPEALAKMDEGDPAGTAHALKEHLYFTGSEAAYATAMTSLFREYHRRWPAP